MHIAYQFNYSYITKFSFVSRQFYDAASFVWHIPIDPKIYKLSNFIHKCAHLFQIDLGDLINLIIMILYL